MTRSARAKRTATLLAVALDVPGATCCTTLEAAADHLRDVAFESMLAAVPAAELLAWPALSHAVLDTAVVAVLPIAPDAATQALLLERGVQDIVVPAEAPADALRRLPFTTWLRLQRMVEGSQTACVLVGSETMARSSAGLTLKLLPNTESRIPRVRFHDRLFEGLNVHARVIRARARAHEEAAVALTTAATNCA
jgi:hypothetical protein